MSQPTLVHEHDKVAIARHIHQKTQHAGLGRLISHIAAKHGVRAGKSAGGPRRQLRVMAKPATTAPKKNKVPFDYAHSRGR